PGPRPRRRVHRRPPALTRQTGRVPSYRVSAAVGLLQPGTTPENVLPEAVAVARENAIVEAFDLAVVRGEARVTVRFEVVDDQTARRVGWAVLARLDELADISGRQVTRRFGARWLPLRVY